MQSTILRMRSYLVNRLRGQQHMPSLRKRGLRLGRNVYTAGGVVFDPGFLPLITVGDDTTISGNVHILAHDGSTKMHMGYSRVAPVSIGSRVFIGFGAIVLPGVCIGDDAIVGAGSVITRDIPSGTVVAGNPARVIGQTAEYVDRHRVRLTQSYIFSRPEIEALDSGSTGKRSVALRTEGGYVE